MMKERAGFKGLICNLLILLAPLAIANTACFYLWGEPECPEALKE